MDFLFEILKQGGFAAVAALITLLYFRKEKECESYRTLIGQLYERLEKKSEKYLDQTLRLGHQTTNAIAALTEEINEALEEEDND
jgi:hypothetical protein